MDDRPMWDGPRGVAIMRIFAARARAEIERLQRRGRRCATARRASAICTRRRRSPTTRSRTDAPSASGIASSSSCSATARRSWLAARSRPVGRYAPRASRAVREPSRSSVPGEEIRDEEIELRREGRRVGLGAAVDASDPRRGGPCRGDALDAHRRHRAQARRGGAARQRGAAGARARVGHGRDRHVRRALAASSSSTRRPRRSSTAGRPTSSGQPLDRFLTAELQQSLDDVDAAPSRRGGQARPYVYAPQGLRARDADGREFPVEATISQSRWRAGRSSR